jgi:hypothetical protein
MGAAIDAAMRAGSVKAIKACIILRYIVDLKWTADGIGIAGW